MAYSLVSGPDRRDAAINVEVVRVDEGFDVEFTPLVEGKRRPRAACKRCLV